MSVRGAAVVPKLGDLLTALPNEVLVRIFSYLDPNSLLSVRHSCHRFWLITSDPICWPASFVWEGCSCASDVSKLNFVMQLTKSALKEISVSCLYPFSNCIDSMLACHYLVSVSIHNTKCTRTQVEKLVSLPSLSYLHLDQLNQQQPYQHCQHQQMEIQLLEIIAASSCKLKTFSFTSLSFQVATVEKWTRLMCTPPDLRIALVSPEVYVINLLHLQPAIEHEAYLSVYKFTYGNFPPSHPFLQLHFTPSPSLALVHYPNPSLARMHHQPHSLPPPLVLTASDPTSKRYSCASFNSYCNGKKATFEFADTCNDLTSLLLSDLRILPSTLTAIALMCPNLLYLDLSACYHTLSSTEGMSTVATSCPKLRVLNLSGQKRNWVWELEKQWTILQSMSSLRALFIPAFFICECSQPISMPQLTNLHVAGDSIYDHREGIFNFLLKMPSLEVFKCNYQEPIYQYSGISRCLQSSLKLTHFYLKTFPEKLSLPTDSACYLHMQKFFLECGNFVVSEALTDAMSQSKKLSVLVLRVKSVPANGVTKLITVLPSLSLFNIQTASFESRGKSYTSNVTGFVESMNGITRKKGKLVALKIDICSHLSVRVECPEHFKWFPS